MQLHHLTLHGIGPFAEQFDVDFGALASGGLFLLEGPTGAGKSTIIDAIVFALYGKVASAETSEDRLRSTHVGPEVDSFVDLVLETTHGVFRVRRSPAYDRPKQRGAGTTRQQTKVQLWRLASPHAVSTGELMSTRADEVGAEITRLVGLSREQFVQTIVLPQGEFASFLRAKPEDRRGLLQKVFGTEIYQQIETELAARRAEARRAVEAAQTAIASAVAGFIGAAGVGEDEDGPDDAAPGEVEPDEAESDESAVDDADEAPDAPADAEPRVDEAERLRALVSGDSSELLAAVDARVAQLERTVELARADADAAAAARAAARTACEAAQTLRQCLERRDALREREASLASASEVHAEAVRRLDAARRAAAVTPRLVALDRAVESAADAEEELLDAVGALRERDAELSELVLGGGAAPDDAAATGTEAASDEALAVAPTAVATASLAVDVRVLAQHTATRRDSAADLRALAAVEATLGPRHQAITTAEQTITARDTERASRAAALAERPAARAALEAQHRAAADLGATVESCAEKVTTATAVLTAAREVAGAQEALVGAARSRDQARAAAKAAVDREQRLRQARIDGIAGELAAQLTDGAPCPVCGGTEHPAPAAVDEDHTSPEAVQQAEAAREAAERALEVAVGAHHRAETALEKARQASGGLSVDEAQDVLAAAEAGHAAATAARAEAQQLLAALADHDRATAALSEQVAADDAWLAAERARLAEQRETLDADAARVHAGRGDHPSVADMLRELEGDLTALEALDAAWHEHRRAAVAVATATADVQEALTAEGFHTADDASAAALPKQTLTQLDRLILDHESERAAVRAGLADPRVAQLDETLTLAAASDGCDEARRAQSDADARADVAHGRSAGAADRLAAAQRAAAQVHTAVQASARRRDELLPVIRMADLATATQDNSLALTLGTYVLTRRFEEVVAAANDRLQTMSMGRYELVRSTEKEGKGGRKLGLALRVLDHRVGTERDPKTLSGGETFYASLCLALGLADVVTAEAGGVDLGTLFVDEGFGSLDPETLELVLAELSKLRAGGRTVGVVSHVESMKSAISDRISVRRKADGTSTLTVLAGVG
ncbi:nuclease SbcCD subunit C [Flavimobilis marinus]|uniref:Nuclease SbcCD subunit C n=1 Tax=Flavimobilis marinus TaxID=285351 RepID=A0A1I2CAV0_9MICO|nr:SMC family ATPase [Flavimobilis marinus]GHG48066.1 nuclease SbcCD subunit C [Flavimobilis marinus]SFE65295.1 exonuclease SbcC [Flavimobilis marinus]